MSAHLSELLSAIGIAPASFDRFVEWALTEHLVAVLVSETPDACFTQPDGMRVFKRVTDARTGRRWSADDLDKLYQRVRKEKSGHVREALEYGEYLKLIWQVPLQCATCGSKPPEVVLHIDHIEPVSRGGRTTRENLQFLCESHNLKKSNNREVTDQWLDSL